ncbi:unnamed protein product, partial [Cladocopium goreaui]
AKKAKETAKATQRAAIKAKDADKAPWCCFASEDEIRRVALGIGRNIQRSHPALAMPRMTSSDSGASASASGQLLGNRELGFSAKAVATSVGGALHRALAKKRWKAKYSPNTG